MNPVQPVAKSDPNELTHHYLPLDAVDSALVQLRSHTLARLTALKLIAPCPGCSSEWAERSGNSDAKIWHAVESYDIGKALAHDDSIVVRGQWEIETIILETTEAALH